MVESHSEGLSLSTVTNIFLTHRLLNDTIPRTKFIRVETNKTGGHHVTSRLRLRRSVRLLCVGLKNSLHFFV